MATAPAKPPLHNFPLSFLKWGSSSNNNNNNHRYRRHVTTSAEGSKSHPPSSQHERVRSRAARHRFSLASCSSEKLPHNSDKPNDETDGEDDEEEEEEEAKPVPAVAEEEEAAAEVQKPWNLRPRRAAPVTSMMTSAKGNHNGGGEVPEAKSMRLRGMAVATAEGGARSNDKEKAKEKEKRKFWIALSKDEIEEDIFIMTGSRPARRPKKRPRNVQKQLDNCFPGLWLVGYSADAYRTSDIPTKK